jgi:hypothetical protein
MRLITDTRLVTITVIFFCVLFMTSYAQSQLTVSKNKVSVINDRPTVYLTFEREGKRESVLAGESNQGIWLRLHNNSKWAINFCTPSLYIPPKVAPIRLPDGRGVLALVDGVEVSVCHGVEELKSHERVLGRAGKAKKRKTTKGLTQQVGYDTSDVSSSAWLASGSSIVFSVPREHLAKGLAIFVRFNYEWEYGERTFRSDEPEHRVYFRASDLVQKPSVIKGTRLSVPRGER